MQELPGDADTFIDMAPVANGYDDVVGWWTADKLGLLANPGEGCDLRDTTDENLAKIEVALVNYLRQNGSLPCPAQPEDFDPLGDPLGIAPASCSGSGDDGVVPFRTLGLAQGIAQDGFARLFTYHVDLAYTDTVGADLVEFCAENNDDIEVTDLNGEDVVDFGDTPIVYVLVSHGQNGYGHYEAGSANQVDANDGTPFEDENADDDGDYVDAPLLASGVNAGFDDEVRWQTRDNMAAAAGNPCP